MSLAYFKRFRMEIGLYDPPAMPTLPDGYFWVPWDESLIEHHAEVKFHSFREEIDAAVFPSLSHRPGCLSLMCEIRKRRDFVPEATWLIACGDGCCGTVQGIRERTGVGAIQNVGVTPEHRGKGIGSALVLQALHGFRRAGLGKAVLEVTAQNESAIQLYRKLGFRFRKTVYKTVDVGPTYSI
jgi:ribosomal protein S18 acetylase RimI-like enzyme